MDRNYILDSQVSDSPSIVAIGVSEAHNTSGNQSANVADNTCLSRNQWYLSKCTGTCWP